MTKHLQLGQLGESLAADYLISLGYTIRERNWRIGKAEIDLIALVDDILVFVEVKTRSTEAFGLPEEGIDRKKEAILTDAAGEYMEKIEHDWEIRFDVISIIIHPGGAHDLTHLKDVFFPGEE